MYATNMPSGTCYGDSGGPNFMTINNVEVIIGVTSFGTAACGSGLDGSVRVDTYATWIETYIMAHDMLPPTPTCNADGLCASDCPAPDPDCPCADDGHCTAACGDIVSDADCAGCLSGDVCRNDCPALDTDCCATDGTCNAACGNVDTDCVPPDPGNGNNPGEEEEGEGDGKNSGGCSSTGSGSWALLALLGLVLFVHRRAGYRRA
jgi:uncharacterized protein (TIGR03382 family)